MELLRCMGSMVCWKKGQRQNYYCYYYFWRKQVYILLTSPCSMNILDQSLMTFMKVSGRIGKFIHVCAGDSVVDYITVVGSTSMVN
jgi:hypothetical protein